MRRLSRFTRWILALIVLCAAATGVLPVSSAEANAERCVYMGVEGFQRGYMVNIDTGQVISDRRQRPPVFVEYSVDPMDTSPDQRHVLYSKEVGNQKQILWASADRSRPRLLAVGNVKAYKVVWSSDSQRLSYFLLTYDSKDKLTSVTWDVINTQDGSHSPIAIDASDFPYFEIEVLQSDNWSPDGQQLAIVLIQDQPKQGRLYVRNRDGFWMRAVDLPDQDSIQNILWSPDGRYIAIFGNSASVRALMSVMFFSVADGKLITMPKARDMRYEGNFWSPNSRYFYVQGRINGSTDNLSDGWDIYTVDGRVYPKLTAGYPTVTWRPDSWFIYISPDSRPETLTALNPDTGEKRVLSNNSETKPILLRQAILWQVPQSDGTKNLEVTGLYGEQRRRVINNFGNIESANLDTVLDGIDIVWSESMGSNRPWHLTFITSAGRVRSDFTTVHSTGNIFS